MATLGEHLVKWLELYGVDTIFGIPGVHTVDLYRGLAQSPIRHVTPRHEQGAAFMADGYARASGRIAACFLITGPGLTNALTPMAQAKADSVPMLVVSAVNARKDLGAEAGDLHEVARQGLLGAQCAVFGQTLHAPEQLAPALARAWAVFEGARPGPVHLEIPRDLLAVEIGPFQGTRPPAVIPPGPAEPAVSQAAAWLAEAEAPLILVGGGAQGGAATVRALAERLDAPVVMTTNARGILPGDHPLSVPASPSLQAVRRLLATADTVLACGTEIGWTDYRVFSDDPITYGQRLIRVDLSAEQLARGAVSDLPMVADTGAATAAILSALPTSVATGGAVRAKAAREGVWQEQSEVYRACIRVLDLIRDALPGAPIIGDSTQAIYAGNLAYAAPAPRQWFNAATGYGALGYGLPAAIGAARALPGRPVICLAGDGGVQFTLADLGTAVEERLPVILIVWNNSGYGEIKRAMIAGRVKPVGVDLHTPDFVALGAAYGVEAARIERLDALAPALEGAARRDGPSLLEIDEELALSAR